MPENMTSYRLPEMPSLQSVIGTGTPSAQPDTIFNLLKAPQARMTDALPSIQSLLLDNQAPAIAAVREGARSNRASAQSDAMKRGLTGSDIEAANMTAATSQGETAVGQLIAQQSSALAQYIMEALGMDIQANREQFVTLAQALGQELTAQRDMQMAREMREFAASEASRDRKSALWGAGIAAGGNVLGGLLRK